MTNEESQLARNGSEKKPIKKSKQRHMVRITYLCCHSNSPQFLTVFSFSVYTSKIKDPNLHNYSLLMTKSTVNKTMTCNLLLLHWILTRWSFNHTQTSFFIEDRSSIIINMKYLMHTLIWVRYQQCRMNEIVPL